MSNITSIKLRRNRRFRRRPNKTTHFHTKHTPPSLILNNSKHTLNRKQIELLNLGMNYCPPAKPKATVTNFDLHKFRKRLRNQFKYGTSTTDNRPPFIKPSSYSPKKSIEILEKYVDDITKYTHNRLFHDTQPTNFKARDIYPTILSLQNLTNTIFKPADKSGKVVILDTPDYLRESYRQLQNREYYVPQIFDPTHILCNKINRILLKMKLKKIITTANYTYLQPSVDTKTPVFYHIPKIHKTKKQGIYPGRPICSACDSPLEGIAQYVDYYLNPLLQKTNTYIKDSNYLLDQLHKINNVNQQTFLITADVSALYTSIPHADIITAVNHILQSRNKPHHPPTDTLLELVHLILHNNYFEFNQVIYHQIKGVAMGSKASPTLACIFMVHLEQPFLTKQILKPTYYGRYIDDIIIIVNNTYKHIIKFLQAMNTEHPHIKYTWTISNKQAVFLDLRIYKKHLTNNTHILISDLHTKSTNVHQYLHYQSNHPKHCFKSIIYSQAIRIVRIVHDKHYMIHRLRTLTYDLIYRGYPKDIIRQQIIRALKTQQRPNNYHYVTTTKGHMNRPPLVITYNKKLDDMGYVLHRLFNNIKDHPTINAQITNPPILAFRKPKNLGNYFIHSKYIDSDDNITPAVHNKRCKMCPRLLRIHTLSSLVTPETIHIDPTLRCTTTNVIYAIVCKLCKHIYIGETSLQLNIRFTHHRHHILRDKPLTPVAMHFHSSGHTYEHVTITPITRVTNTQRRKSLEKRYINTLHTKYPFGINYTPVTTQTSP